MSGDEVEKITPSSWRAISRWLNVVLDLNKILCVYGIQISAQNRSMES